MRGIVKRLAVSSDLYHWNDKLSQQVDNARAAASQLGISTGVIRVAQPDANGVKRSVGQLPLDETGIMYRGRAAQNLVEGVKLHSFERFTACPFEDLRNPGRVHVDPFGNLHICQGISLGNVFQQPLSQICSHCDPDTHPVIAPLLSGGPSELVRSHSLLHQQGYADACHLCDHARRQLRKQYPEILMPDQMYGVA